MLTPPAVASLTLEDRNGIVLRGTRTDAGALQRGGALGDIDPDVLAAFLAGEDHRFYQHHGVDGRAVARAFGQNLRARHVRSGAATITMQLARILRSSGERRTIAGKVQQALWALRLGAHLTKQALPGADPNPVPP